MAIGSMTGLALALFAATAAQAAPTPEQAVTAQADPSAVAQTVQTADGRTLHYRAQFETLVLRDDADAPQATITGTSYQLDAAAKERRPVLFAFNGGPGASSSPLHFSAMGPRLIERQADGTRRLIPNADTLLPLADLVFVDPVGTGFSRVLPGGSGAPYWSVPGDAAAMMRFIRHWLVQHQRQGSPVYIAGESYGGRRLAELAGDAGDLEIAGLIFISPAVCACDGPDLPYILGLPGLAIAAAHHGKAHREDPDAIFTRARTFALGDYANALLQGNRLPPDRRRRIAEAMAELIGLPVSTIEAADLRIDAETFRKTLRADEGLDIGRLDTRVTAPSAKPVTGEASAKSDPALGLNGSNVILNPRIGDYLHRDLRVPGRSDYISLTLDVNAQWNWTAGAAGYQRPDPMAGLEKLIRNRPATRLLVVTGDYDLAVPPMEVEYAFAHSAIPPQGVRFVRLANGHAAFEGAEGRQHMQSLLRDFVR
ncbi:S10 family serine carboxypeptidase-like protein [Sphingomonas sp. 35-24ZXX]|uniref:S10 family serine carboxypeptidase-like protein n=1 Tax=Sphingomonas sp. 35-24ZXX TaxID=1545915 RepID=UPI00053BFE92|nr:hypothetical protein [Sphingomonas sp. 35-24ZXX]